MNKKNIIRTGIVLAAVAAVLIITQAFKKPTGPQDNEQPVRPVKTLRVESIPSEKRRVFPGRLQASQTVNLSFLYGGDLIDFPVQEGQQLEEGDLIAALDDRDARSNLEAAAADLNLAQVELDRSRTLFEEELISAAEFDVKERGYDVAAAAYDRAEKAVEDRLIRAPFIGVVAKRFVENREKVQAGQTIVTYIDPEGLDVIIDIPESTVVQLPNYTWSATASFEQDTEIEYPLDIREFSTVADSYTKTYALTLHMDRPEDIVVLPDMTVSVNLDVVRKETIDIDDYMVPSTAIVYDVETDNSVVWVVNENADPIVVEPRSVVAERTANGEVVVTDGLDDGDLIVIAGGGFLNRDQPVRIFEQ